VLFREGKIDYTSEQNVEVLFHNQKVGTHRLDFIVDGEIIIELKRAASITKQTLAQARSYMNTLEMPYSIIINFPFDEEEGVQIEELGDVEIAEEFAPNDEQYKKEFAFLED